MPKFCTSCGTELKDEIAFCTECGTAAEASKEPPKSAAPQTPPAQQQNPPPTASASAPAPVMQMTGGKNGIVSTGKYFGLMLLFSIPVVGWIACIIMAFTSANLNVRHYARAMLIWIMIGLVIGLGLYFLFSWITDMLMQALSEATGGQFGEWSDFIKPFRNVGFGKLPIN